MTEEERQREIDELIKQEARDTLTRIEVRSYPTIDEIKQFGGRLPHMTYDARMVIERSGKKDNLTLYWQVWLVLKCFNHGAEYVLKVILLSKESSLLSVVQEEFGYKTWLHPHRHVKFSMKAIWNLYLLDRSLIVADHNVPLDRVSDYMERLSQEMIDRMIEDEDRTTLSLLMLKIEVIFDEVEATERRMAVAHEKEYVIEPIEPVDPTANAMLQKALEDIQSIPKEDP